MNAFASGIHSCCSASRATANNQHVKRFFRIDLRRFPACSARIYLGHNFFNRHAARTKHLAVQEHHGHRHDFALGHFLLEGTAFNHNRLDLRIEDGHQ